MTIDFIIDPLLTTAGAVRPALLLAREFYKNGYEVNLITPRFDLKLGKKLRMEGIYLKAIGPEFSFIPSHPTLDAWARCLIRNNVLDKKYHSDFIINTSSCIIAQAHIYYAQGPMTKTLDSIYTATPFHYKYTYYLLRPLLRTLERKFVERIRDKSDFFIANSSFCALMHREWNIKINNIITPPLDCTLFKPTTSKPTTDYVLTHFGTYGKEGRFPIIKEIANAGVIIKAFGDKSSIPRPLTKHPNIHFLGKVTTDKLIDLYSNALYTLFAFSHEPFGYVPIESMACGTPVLTYNKEGPSETVINGNTGWLVNTDHKLFTLASTLWEIGYKKKMRDSCRKRALSFDIKKISKEWLKLLNSIRL